MNINNSTTPICINSMTPKRLGCAVYSHCLTNDSYSKCTYSCCCCLPSNYATKPHAILQRVIKSQKVCISFGHSKTRYLFSQKNLRLNFQTCF